MGENVLIALLIMLKGMAGIFTAILLIMAFVWILSKIGTKKPEEKTDKNA